MLRAAIDGAGFIPTSDAYPQPHLESGVLVEVLPDWSESFPGPFLDYPSRRTMPSPLRAFVGFVQSRRWFAGQTGRRRAHGRGFVALGSISGAN